MLNLSMKYIDRKGFLGQRLGQACPQGQGMIAGQCSPGAIYCDGTLVEVAYTDPNQAPQPTGKILATGWTLLQAQGADGVHIVNSDDPRCQAAAPPPALPQAAPLPAAAPPPAAASPALPAVPVAAPPGAVTQPPATAPLPTTLEPSVSPTTLTTESLPTGAFPGAAFLPKVPLAPAPAFAPAEIPSGLPPVYVEECPVAPLPLQDWTSRCGLKPAPPGMAVGVVTEAPSPSAFAVVGGLAALFGAAYAFGLFD